MSAVGAREEQRRRVLDVASGLFAERGFDNVTMTDIADGADVARATVFNYFGSKYAVIEAITETVLVFYRAMLDEALADEETPTAGLVRALSEDMGKGIEAQRRFFRSVFREITRIQLGLDESSVAQQASEDTKSRLVLLFRRGQERGEVNDEFDAAALAAAYTSLVNGTITNWLYHDEPGSLTPRMREAAEVFLSPVELRTKRRTR